MAMERQSKSFIYFMLNLNEVWSTVAPCFCFVRKGSVEIVSFLTSSACLYVSPVSTEQSSLVKLGWLHFGMFWSFLHFHHQRLVMVL